MKLFDLDIFNRAQWSFLAVMAVFEEPVSIDIIEALSPLKPGELIQVVQTGGQLGLLQQTDNDLICLVDKIPTVVQKKLKYINTIDRLNTILDNFVANQMNSRISTVALANLLARSGQTEEAASLNRELATEAIDNGLLDEGFDYLFKSLKQLKSGLGQNEIDKLYLDASLEFSDLHFIQGRNLDELSPVLNLAISVADRIGDKRSLSLIQLNKGLLLWISGKTVGAGEQMELGQKLVNELGDTDIINRSATLIGLYYFLIKGNLKRATEHFEIAVNVGEKSGTRWNLMPAVVVGLSSTLINQNQFYRAIGDMEYHWLRAKDQNLNSIATIFRASLGSALLRVNQILTAYDHLSAALKEAESQKNLFAMFLARSGIAFYYIKKDRYDDAREMMIAALKGNQGHQYSYAYVSPIQLEILSKLEHLGKKPIPGYECDYWFQTLIDGTDIFMKGVALRLRVQCNKGINSQQDNINDLLLGQKLLKQSNGLYELAKTEAVLAQYRFEEGAIEEARQLANSARRGLAGHGEQYFPHSLRRLTGSDKDHTSAKTSLIDLQKQFVKTLENIHLPMSIKDAYESIIPDVSRMLDAERGGFFVAKSGQERNLVLRAALNLNQADIDSPDFRSSLDAIRECLVQNRLMKIQNNSSKQAHEIGRILTLVCLPIVSKNVPFGVLYYDRSYDPERFANLESESLKWLSTQSSLFLELINQVNRIMDSAKNSAQKQSIGQTAHETDRIISQSKPMEKLLIKADRAAQSDSSILINGETGVGKELLARRLHRKSPRNSGPFIIFTPGTVPENLVESELFGHEKGAYTGADRFRQGLIESAHQGTLFIDELSEFPKSVQVKLLRVLQEKTFCRIGSNRMRTSDFRLIAATNLNLAEEISSGRFREDLYYRLNAIALKIPPLRERKKDIIPLADFFLQRHPLKNHRPQRSLSAKNRSVLKSYQWPGNVRELKNVIEQAVVLSKGQELEIFLPKGPEPDSALFFSDFPSMDELQRRYIQYVLTQTKGIVSGPNGATTLLDMKRTTLQKRMKKLGFN